MKRPPSLMTFRLRMTLMVVLISFAPTAHAQTFTTFDVPDSRSTQASAINPAGQITGIYEDISVGLHGFLRQPDGTIITFDVPGAGSGNGLGTFGQAINPAGKIAGFYFDPDNPEGLAHVHAFLRQPDGTIIIFDGPEATSTYVAAISPDGDITGFEGQLPIRPAFPWHGYLRQRDGTIITFDVPGGSTAFPQSIFPSGINPAGQIVGRYIGADRAIHGFLRQPDGTIITFDPSGSSYTAANAINPAGQITGIYSDPNDTIHGFLRQLDGTITTFDVPGASTGNGRGTFGQAINPAGEITGFFYDTTGITGVHGFVRSAPSM